MKFGGFKIGKSKEKEIPQESAAAEATEEAVPEIPLDAEPIRPHPPLQELSLDTPVGEENGDSIATEEASLSTEEAGEVIKMMEIQADPAATASTPPPVNSSPPPVVKNETGTKEAGNLDLSSSISNIFTNMEDEENPLANLIKVLPDVAATELLDDLKEINDIIKDWQKK
jgi:hypothetical protein